MLYEPLMPSGSYKKKVKEPKQTRNDPPAGLDDYIHDIGQKKGLEWIYEYEIPTKNSMRKKKST